VLFRIFKRNSKSIAVTVIADGKSKYTGMNPALTAVVTGTVNGGDTINYTLATTASILYLGLSIAVTLGIILTIYCCFN
jgi:ABC-type nitrate/sulfonate/bicarbonate transport system permease component